VVASEKFSGKSSRAVRRGLARAINACRSSALLDSGAKRIQRRGDWQSGTVPTNLTHYDMTS